MKRLFAGFTLVCAASAQALPIKVACVGDSIALGTGLPNAETSSYPAQLQKILGYEFEVKNFASANASISRSTTGLIAIPSFSGTTGTSSRWRMM